MNFEQVQPLLRLGSWLQWLVIALVSCRVSANREILLGQESRYHAGRDRKHQGCGVRQKISDLQQKRLNGLKTPGRHRTGEGSQIPETMIPQLKGDLSNNSGSTVRLACDKGDKEALAFAEQLKGLFEECGWTVKGVGQALHSSR